MADDIVVIDSEEEETVVDNGTSFVSSESAEVAEQAAREAKLWAEESERQALSAIDSADTAVQARDDAVAAKEYAESAITDVNLITVATDLQSTPSNIKTVATNISNVNAVGGNISNVNAVAGNATNINAVNSNKTNIDTVAGISSNVTTVAGISGNVTTVAGISSDVTTIAAIDSDISTLAGISSDVSTVSGISSAVSSVASNSTNINKVATDINRVKLVADDLTNVDTVAIDISNIVDVADNKTNIDTVATNINSINTNATNINDIRITSTYSHSILTTATNISNVNTVAGIDTDISTVSGISSDVSVVSSNATDISSVASDLTNINSVASDLTNINAVAADLTNIDNASSYASEAKQWAIGDPTEPTGGSAKYWAGQASQGQIQSDWNQTDNTQKDYIKNKPTIPAAQVNSDWNAVSGVAEILNKPSLATVATSGAYSDLSGTPTIPTVDQTYNASSTNAQSGVAVASAISGKADDNDVVHLAGTQTITGNKTFTDELQINGNDGYILFHLPGVQYTKLKETANGLEVQEGGSSNLAKLYAGASDANNSVLTTVAHAFKLIADGVSYVKLGNGLIIQWGYIAGATGVTTHSVTFATPFTNNGSYTCVPVVRGFSSTVYTTNYSTTGVDIVTSSAGGIGWIAIGY